MPWIDTVGYLTAQQVAEAGALEAAELGLAEGAALLGGPFVAGAALATGAYQTYRRYNQPNSSMVSTRSRKRNYRYVRLATGAPAPAVRARKQPGRLNYRTGGFLGLDVKYSDSESDALVYDTLANGNHDPPVMLNMFQITQGTGPTERIGSKVVIKSLSVKGKLTFAPTTDETKVQTYVRILIIQDKQTNGAQMALTDALALPTNAELVTEAFHKLENQDRFKILKDFKVRRPPSTSQWVNGTTGATSAGERVSMEMPFYAHCKMNLNVRYKDSATTGNIGDLMDNSVHMFIIKGKTLLTSETVTAKYNCRVRFIG